MPSLRWNEVAEEHRLVRVRSVCHSISFWTDGLGLGLLAITGGGAGVTSSSSPDGGVCGRLEFMPAKSRDGRSFRSDRPAIFSAGKSEEPFCSAGMASRDVCSEPAKSRTVKRPDSSWSDRLAKHECRRRFLATDFFPWTTCSCNSSMNELISRLSSLIAHSTEFAHRTGVRGNVNLRSLRINHNLQIRFFCFKIGWLLRPDRSTVAKVSQYSPSLGTT